MPAALAAVGVEGHDRCGVEVVAFAGVAVVIRAGIPGAEKHQVLVGIVRAGHPDRSASSQIRVASRPRSASRVVGPGDRIEAPRAPAGLRVVGVDEPANPEFSAGDADDDLVPHDERSDRCRISELVVGQGDVVGHSAGAHVKREQVRVGSRHEQAIAKDTEAAVDGAAAEVQVLRELAAVMPDLPARSRIDRPGVVVEAGHVQHAVDHQRRRLKAALCTGLERPLRGQLMDVFRRDLREGAVAMAEVIAGVGQPP